MSAQGYVPTEVIVAGATALGSAIAVLWRRNEKIDQRYDELNRQHTETVAKVGKLEGKHDGILSLSASVIETVRITAEKAEAARSQQSEGTE